ncbi:MAG: hypothetical protein GY903_06885 [Fuerstiella sp.]|nr:hypothetical protein [Fuerstiella sp.]MCP4854201.1 hypothetical protein [Fuerstiella sp.]
MAAELPLPDAIRHLMEKRITAPRREEMRNDEESAEIAAGQAEAQRTGPERRASGRRLEE